MKRIKTNKSLLANSVFLPTFKFYIKMSDFPDPDEEYELMYADDLELLQEEDDHIGKYFTDLPFGSFSLSNLGII